MSLSNRTTVILGSILLSGLMTYVITLGFAGGGIADNAGDEKYAGTVFFINFYVWGLGAFLALISLVWKNSKFFKFSLIFLWISCPICTWLIISSG